MKRIPFRKYRLQAFFVIMIALFLPIAVLAAEEFIPLAPLPGIDTSSPESFFNSAFRFGIIIAAFLAVFMIVVGGFKYMTTEAVSGKGDAKDQITSALAGLFLVLLSVTLLQIINPDILKINLFRNADQLDKTHKRRPPNLPIGKGYQIDYKDNGKGTSVLLNNELDCKEKEISLKKEGVTITKFCHLVDVS